MYLNTCTYFYYIFWWYRKCELHYRFKCLDFLINKNQKKKKTLNKTSMLTTTTCNPKQKQPCSCYVRVILPQYN